MVNRQTFNVDAYCCSHHLCQLAAVKKTRIQADNFGFWILGRQFGFLGFRPTILENIFMVLQVVVIWLYMIWFYIWLQKYIWVQKYIYRGMGWAWVNQHSMHLHRCPSFAFQHQHLSSFSAVLYLVTTVKFYKTIFRFNLFNLPIDDLLRLICDNGQIL